MSFTQTLDGYVGFSNEATQTADSTVENTTGTTQSVDGLVVLPSYAWLDPSGATILVVSNTAPPAGQAGVNITYVDPQPDVGWTTPDGGVTWTEPGPSDPLGNQARLLASAQAALPTNELFLTLENPTDTEIVEQLKSITEQATGFIRLWLGLLSTTEGT